MFEREDNDRNIQMRKTTGKSADSNIPPVLFMLFNRASTTQKVFEKVREARPSKIFVAANGPRPNVPSDQEKCSAVQAIFDLVDWDCEVYTNFRKVNIGMQRHWHASLDWFFENVESGIILEDDCVPNPSFFSYCSELLERYKDDERIMHINGSNFQFGQKRGDASYYFSKYPHVWGWATWKRAWMKYDNNMTTFHSFKGNNLIDLSVTDDRQKKYWMKFFEGLYSGIYDTCDAKWLYAIWLNNGFCVTPNVNMVTNIGYGLDAGHTVIKEKTMGQENFDIGKITHPDSSNLTYNKDADAYTFKTYYWRTFLQKVFFKMTSWFSNAMRFIFNIFKRIGTARNMLRALGDGIIYLESLLHSRAASDPKKKRILILRKDGLGDCIIFYPTLKAYRNFYKDAEITIVLPDPFESLSPLLGSDLVDKIIWFEHAAFRHSFLYRRKFLLDLKKAGYDVFIYPVPSRESIGYFMMKMTGAPERISFGGELSDHGKKLEDTGAVTYTKIVSFPENMRKEIDRYVYFAKEVTGRDIEVRFPTIDIKKLSDKKAMELAHDNGFENKKYAVMFPGAGAQYRIWPLEKFAEIVDYVTDKGIVALMCGGEKEKSLVKNIISLTNNKNIVDLSGKTDLTSLAHILSKAQFYFGSDTGILHLAVAVGTPAVATVGKGGLWRFFPYGNPETNRVVYDKTREYITGSWDAADIPIQGEIHPSIKNITVEDAKKEIDHVLNYTS